MSGFFEFLPRTAKFQSEFPCLVLLPILEFFVLFLLFSIILRCWLLYVRYHATRMSMPFAFENCDVKACSFKSFLGSLMEMAASEAWVTSPYARSVPLLSGFLFLLDSNHHQYCRFN